MKILHIGKFDYLEFGGIEKVCFDIIDEMSVDNQIIYLYFGNKNSITHKKNIIKYSSKMIFNIFNQPISLSFIINYFKILKLKPNVIHVHLPNYLILLCLFFTNNKILKKTVIHWHSDVLNKKYFLKTLFFLEINILRRIHTIIATSNEYILESKILFKFSYKVIVIPICIKLNSNLQIKFNNTTDILSVGRLVPYKGFDLLIKACAHIRSDFTLKIIGNGPEYYKLKNLINKLNLNNKVQILNNVSNCDLIEFYKSSGIFCLPSINRSEAYGLSMLEAISFGLVTISFDIPGSGLNYLNAKGIRIKEITPENLAINIEKLIKKEDLRFSIYKNNINYYKINFNFKNYINSYLELYRNI